MIVAQVLIVFDAPPLRFRQRLLRDNCCKIPIALIESRQKRLYGRPLATLTPANRLNINNGHLEKSPGLFPFADKIPQPEPLASAIT
jgi:hypothetical protein